MPTRRLLVPWVSSWKTISVSRPPSRSIVGPVKRNICMRPETPSGGVAKLALLVPDASCTSASTRSLPRPHAAEVGLLEVGRGLVEAQREELVVVPVGGRRRVGSPSRGGTGRSAWSRWTFRSPGRGLAGFGVAALRRRQEVGLEVARRRAQEVAVAGVGVRVAGRSTVAVEHAGGVGVAGVRRAPRGPGRPARCCPGSGSRWRCRRRPGSRRSSRSGWRRCPAPLHADDRRRRIPANWVPEPGRHRVRRLRRRAVGRGRAVGLHVDAEARVVGRDVVADVLAPQQRHRSTASTIAYQSASPVVKTTSDQAGTRSSRGEREEHRAGRDLAGDVGRRSRRAGSSRCAILREGRERSPVGRCGLRQPSSLDTACGR